MSSSDSTFVKVCPDCGSEFVPTVEICYDCGAALESRPQDLCPAEAPPDRVAAPAANTEPADGWVLVQSADLDWAQELARRLDERGIKSRLAKPCASCRPTLDVFVATLDAIQAHAVAHQLYVEKMPDLEGTAALELPATDRCPACGERVPDAAPECPECGLAFLPVEEAG